MEVIGLDIEKLVDICRHNDGVFLGVFGSFARGEASENSDVDLLTDAAISPYLRERIERELVGIYGQA